MLNAVLAKAFGVEGLLPKQGAAVSSPPSTGRFRGWGAANSWYVWEDPCKRRLPRRRISPKSADWRPPLLVSATAPQLRKLSRARHLTFVPECQRGRSH